MLEAYQEYQRTESRIAGWVLALHECLEGARADGHEERSLHVQRQIYLIAHVDDVHGTGPRDELKKLFEELGKHILLTMEPMLIPGGEGSFLKRTHAWGSEDLVTVRNKQLLED